MTTTIHRSSGIMQKTATFTAVSALLAGAVMSIATANAAETAVNVAVFCMIPDER